MSDLALIYNMELETKRLILRRWTQNDKIPFREINKDLRVMEFYPNTCTSIESDQIVDDAEKHFEKYGFGLLAVELKNNNKLIGFVGLQNVPFDSHFTPAVEIGWRVSYNQWGKEYATEAAKAIIEWGFSHLNLNEIVAMTVPQNNRSRRVMEKVGMLYDKEGDFENPRIPLGHQLRQHVLYRIRK